MLLPSKQVGDGLSRASDTIVNDTVSNTGTHVAVLVDRHPCVLSSAIQERSFAMCLKSVSFVGGKALFVDGVRHLSVRRPKPTETMEHG